MQVDPFEATSLLTLAQMVDNGLGVTLLPQLAVDAGLLKGTDLKTIPRGQGPAAPDRAGLAARTGGATIPPARPRDQAARGEGSLAASQRLAHRHQRQPTSSPAMETV